MSARVLAGALVLGTLVVLPTSAVAAPSCVRPPPTNGPDDAPACATSARKAIAGALAAKDPSPRAREEQAEAAEAAMAAFDAFCKQPIAAGAPARIPGCEDLGYDAARAFRAAGRAGRAIVAGRAVVEHEQRAGTSSPITAKATLEVARGYEGLAAYEHAADWYERLAQRYPASTEGEAAAKSHVLLRLGLGETEKAVAAADAYVKAYGATQPATAATVLYAIGASHEEGGDHAAAIRHFGRWMATLDRAPPDVRAQAHATYGRALAASEGPKSAKAAAEYAAVRALFASPEGATQAIEAAWKAEDEGSRMRHLARALTAWGEALFVAAEARRVAEVSTLIVPVYNGNPEQAAISAWADKELRPWMVKRQRAIEGVEADFAKILVVKPEPPPRWVVAAGAVVATMWGDFADDLRKGSRLAKAPKDPAVRQAYEALIHSAADPIVRGRATPATKRCLDFAVKFQIVDERTNSCEAWLAENDPDHFRRGGELVPKLRAGAPPRDPPLLP